MGCRPLHGCQWHLNNPHRVGKIELPLTASAGRSERAGLGNADGPIVLTPAMSDTSEAQSRSTEGPPSPSVHQSPLISTSAGESGSASGTATTAPQPRVTYQGGETVSPTLDAALARDMVMPGDHGLPQGPTGIHADFVRETFAISLKPQELGL